ncbi:hypothetical protein CC79DRAFT_1359549 [Sarocladium strictum]
MYVNPGMYYVDVWVPVVTGGLVTEYVDPLRGRCILYCCNTASCLSNTGQRVEPKSWPANRFAEDPASIPDDDSYDTNYDASTARSRSSEDGSDIYHMYNLDDKPNAKPDAVPPARIVAKRYIPTAKQDQNDQGVTLLMLPGMGLPKERRGCSVAEIWTVDMPMGGETALQNDIGYLYGNEKDITRDVLMFITGYLPLQAGQELPESLPFRRPQTARPQPVRPNLHVVAHSLGAQAAMLCAAHAPDLFASLTVMDPAMIPGGKIRDAYTKLPKDVFCTGLKPTYQNKEEVRSELKKNRRTRGWDDRVVEIFERKGVVDDGQGKLKLAAHPRLEWALYYDKETPTHCYDRLTDISTPFNAIMPSKPFAVPPKVFKADVAKIGTKPQITWVPDTTHQLPFERVDECARLVADWIASQAGAGSKARL